MWVVCVCVHAHVQHHACKKSNRHVAQKWTMVSDVFFSFACDEMSFHVTSRRLNHQVVKMQFEHHSNSLEQTMKHKKRNHLIFAACWKNVRCQFKKICNIDTTLRALACACSSVVPCCARLFIDCFQLFLKIKEQDRAVLLLLEVARMLSAP